MYKYITKYNSPNYTSAFRAMAEYGMPRKITGVTIHHWGDKSTTSFDNVVGYLCRKGGSTSAHYVADGKINQVACIVDPDDIAWHSGDAEGNATTIGIECNPHATDEDYKVVAQLVRELEKTYGKLKLHKHSDWSTTACPGDWDLEKLRKVIDEKDKKMLTQHQLDVLFRLYLGKSPNEKDTENYVGNVTFEELSKKIQKGNNYKKKQEDAKNGTLGLINHLPRSLRENYKELANSNTPDVASKINTTALNEAIKLLEGLKK